MLVDCVKVEYRTAGGALHGEGAVTRLPGRPR